MQLILDSRDNDQWFSSFENDAIIIKNEIYTRIQTLSSLETFYIFKELHSLVFYTHARTATWCKQTPTITIIKIKTELFGTKFHNFINY